MVHRCTWGIRRWTWLGTAMVSGEDFFPVFISPIHGFHVLSKNCFMVLRTGHPHCHVLNVLSKNCLKWCFMVLVIPCHGNPTMMKIDQNGENYRKCSLDICSVYLHFFLCVQHCAKTWHVLKFSKNWKWLMWFIPSGKLTVCYRKWS